MLMKSVIINLKYLIFRSMSAAEGGGMEGWKEEGREERREVCLEERPWWGEGFRGRRGEGMMEAEELHCGVAVIRPTSCQTPGDVMRATFFFFFLLFVFFLSIFKIINNDDLEGFTEINKVNCFSFQKKSVHNFPVWFIGTKAWLLSSSSSPPPPLAPAWLHRP